MGGVAAREGSAEDDGVKREVERGLGKSVEDARGLLGGVDGADESEGLLGRGTSAAAGEWDNEGVRRRAGSSCTSVSRSEGDATGVGGLA